MPGPVRAQHQLGRAQGAARHHDDVGGIAFHPAVALDVDVTHGAAVRRGLEPRRIGLGQQRHVGEARQRRVDADDLGVRLAVEQAGEAVEGVAAHADAGGLGLAVLLVEQDAERQVERMQPLRRPAVAEALDQGLVADGRVGEVARPARLVGVLAGLAVDVEQLLGRGVIGLEGLVADRPGGRDAVRVADLVEVALAQAEQGRAIDLGIAPDVAMQARLEGRAVAAVPGLVDLVAAVDEDGLGVPVGLLARQVGAALQDEDALASGGEAVRHGAAARAAADDDDVVMVLRHGHARARWRRRADRAVNGAAHVELQGSPRKPGPSPPCPGARVGAIMAGTRPGPTGERTCDGEGPDRR